MRAIIAGFGLMFATTSAHAQWRLGIEWMTNRYFGSTHDTSGAHVANGRPGDGVALGIRIGKHWKGTGINLRLALSTTGFAVAGHGINLTDRTTGGLYEAAALISTRVGGIGPSGAVKVEVGPALHLWDFAGEVRARAGALGALAYEWPVASRFGGAIRLEGGVSKSWFDADEVPPEFERRLTWRYGVSLGLNYRL